MKRIKVSFCFDLNFNRKGPIPDKVLRTAAGQMIEMLRHQIESANLHLDNDGKLQVITESPEVTGA